MSEQNKKQQADLDPEAIAAFLRQNPEFFLDRDELLTSLTLKHETGDAVSLVERQVSLLRERNLQMRHRLSSLMSVARENDVLLEKTQRLVLALLEAKNLNQVIRAVNKSLTVDFKADVSALTIISSQQYDDARVVTVEEARAEISSILNSSRAVCGVLRPKELEFLFQTDASKIGSAAVAPISNGNTIGVLAIGSLDADRYRSSMGTIFLTYVSEVLNRILPQFVEK
jgi:hypothetical protein|tara:strand:+ start:5016 stop:5699 length:684 start_codon:yes stop_codon:yes gene_type:complete